jgi:hypothetical protein
VYAGSDRSVGLAGMPAYPPTPACLPAASPLTLRTMVVVGGCHQPPAAAALDLVPRDLLILVGVGPGPWGVRCRVVRCRVEEGARNPTPYIRHPTP